MNFEYTVTETLISTPDQILQIDYQFVETTVESVQFGLTRKQEQRNRTYDATITRKEYQKIAKDVPNALPFDQFVEVLRPFIMGHYGSNELERAFRILDRDHSGSIHLDELANFLPILNGNATSDALKTYVRKVDQNFDGNMNYDEFRALILRGIGREIICNHL
ncbi:unnamed protein product [Didymodactylos carnosus]|uniref:EF-hand domain-containing protein n=1 Tax=Didymodactylos carnosus TaxID=1234261 RepID=A0A814KIU0_9BILA|nr:unnamed protein product [Didymodactylos carnosus]CAF1080677.1 unnamed protein product [Didymodactylos carnosus]CAF3819699.1 unnamed protein product [Didymodactylos carnosus]CAF3843718.1 unnamed protein product [Didymodactylos carnosus]